MLRDIIVFSILFLIIQIFALPSLKYLDFINKAKNKRLISIKKFRYLFIKYNRYKDENGDNIGIKYSNMRYKNKDCNNIGITSFVFQIVHYILSILLFIMAVICIFISNKIFFTITLSLFLLYIGFSFILIIIVSLISSSINDSITNNKNFYITPSNKKK